MARNLVVCSDGTGNTFDGRLSNVTRLVKCLALDRPGQQLVMYDQGVGTTARRDREVSGIVERHDDASALRMLPAPIGRVPPLAWIDRGRGLLTGYGLKDNLRQMYLALAREYRDGDQVFLFGFSRGAFTVRALAAMLHRCHLPHPDSRDVDERFERAWDLLQPMVADVDATAAMRRDHRPCPVHLLGLWDTVKSYGGLKPVILPHLRHNPDVAHVRHALALDERRAWFKPTTWGLLDSDRGGAFNRLDPADGPGFAKQDVLEVWFTGCHSDVGGADQDGTALIALRWMLGEAAGLGLTLNDAGVSLLRGPDPGPPTIHQSWTRAWRVVEQVRRWEINNGGRYPIRERHRGSDGQRDPGGSRRTPYDPGRDPPLAAPGRALAGTVTVHESVGLRHSIRGSVDVCPTASGVGG